MTVDATKRSTAYRETAKRHAFPIILCKQDTVGHQSVSSLAHYFRRNFITTAFCYSIYVNINLWGDNATALVVASGAASPAVTNHLIVTSYSVSLIKILIRRALTRLRLYNPYTNNS